MGVTVTNSLSRTTPVAERVLIALAAETLGEPAKDGKETQRGISTFLEKITELPEAAGYKFILTVTNVDVGATGPLKTYTGAHWDSQHDGTWAHTIEGSMRTIVLSWIKA